MFNSEQLQEKWAPLLNYEGLETIKDSHRRAVTAVLLENQERFLREQSAFESGSMQSLMESPTNSGNAAGAQGAFGGTASSPVAGFDPVLISLIRRSMPNLVAYDLAGVQPMSGPTGLIFAMRSRYTNQSGTEAFYNEADTTFATLQTMLLVLVLQFSLAPTHQFSTQLEPLPQLHTTLVRVCQLVMQKHLTALDLMHSTRWLSQSRKLLLLQSQEH
jgi:hypothetical protein